MPLPVCTPKRIDHQEYNGGGNQQDVCRAIPNLNDGDLGSIYFVYCNRTTIFSTSIFEEAVYFRKYDHATQMMGSASLIAQATTGNVRNVNFARLDNGRLIVTYIRAEPNPQVEWSYSDDNGALWSVPAVIDTNTTFIIDIGQNGDQVWMATRNTSGISTKNYRMFKYIAGLWTDLGVFFVGTTSSNELYGRSQGGGAPKRCFFFFPTENHVLLVVDHFHGVSNPWTVTALWTTDAGTWTPVTVASTTGGGFQPCAISEFVSDERVVTMWQDDNGSENALHIAYTDDEGHTWTTVGEVTDFATLNGTYELAVNDSGWGFGVIDEDQLVVAFTFRTPNDAVWIMSGPVAATGWTVIEECDPTSAGDPQKDIATSSLSQVIEFGEDLVFCFHMVWAPSVGSAYFTYDFVIEEEVFPPEIPPVEEEPAGFKRMFRRGVVQATLGSEPHITRSVGTIDSWRKPRWLEKSSS
jgi:hypothetical protein